MNFDAAGFLTGLTAEPVPNGLSAALAADAAVVEAFEGRGISIGRGW